MKWIKTIIYVFAAFKTELNVYWHICSNNSWIDEKPVITVKDLRFEDKDLVLEDKDKDLWSEDNDKDKDLKSEDKDKDL